MAGRILLLPLHLKCQLFYIRGEAPAPIDSFSRPATEKQVDPEHASNFRFLLAWSGSAAGTSQRMAGVHWMYAAERVLREDHTRVLSVIGMQRDTDSRDRCQQTQEGCCLPRVSEIWRSA